MPHNLTMNKNNEIPIEDQLYKISLQIYSLAVLISGFDEKEILDDKKVFRGIGIHLTDIAKMIENISIELYKKE